MRRPTKTASRARRRCGLRHIRNPATTPQARFRRGSASNIGNGNGPSSAAAIIHARCDLALAPAMRPAAITQRTVRRIKPSTIMAKSR